VLLLWQSLGLPELCNHEHLAVQPLLSQFQYIELHVIDSELNPGVATLAEALGATTTQLRLVFHMFDPACKSGSLSTVSGWLELLDALPHVGSMQITLSSVTWSPTIVVVSLCSVSPGRRPGSNLLWSKS
jgi:hypothetical protein